MLLLRSESMQAAAAALAERIATLLRAAVMERGVASLLVPGGRTPVPLFHALRRQDLPWRQLRVSLTDERWVPEDHPDSNARLVRAELLVEAAAEAVFIPLHNDAPDPARGAARSWHALSALPRPFDAVVLGMGEDGHFASLFPASPGLEAALDPRGAPGCVSMRAPTAPDRISLNLAALESAHHLFLLISGQHKLALVEHSRGRQPLPVDALLALRSPEPAVYWAP